MGKVKCWSLALNERSGQEEVGLRCRKSSMYDDCKWLFTYVALVTKIGDNYFLKYH